MKMVRGALALFMMLVLCGHIDVCIAGKPMDWKTLAGQSKTENFFEVSLETLGDWLKGSKENPYPYVLFFHSSRFISRERGNPIEDKSSVEDRDNRDAIAVMYKVAMDFKGKVLFFGVDMGVVGTKTTQKLKEKGYMKDAINMNFAPTCVLNLNKNSPDWGVVQKTNLIMYSTLKEKIEAELKSLEASK